MLSQLSYIPTGYRAEAQSSILHLLQMFVKRQFALRSRRRKTHTEANAHGTGILCGRNAPANRLDTHRQEASMLNRDALTQAGIDVDEALERVMGNEMLLERVLGMFHALRSAARRRRRQRRRRRHRSRPLPQGDERQPVDEALVRACQQAARPVPRGILGRGCGAHAPARGGAPSHGRRRGGAQPLATRLPPDKPHTSRTLHRAVRALPHPRAPALEADRTTAPHHPRRRTRARNAR